MFRNNRIALSLIIISLILLIPGLIQPILTIDISPSTPFGKINLFKETQSILETAQKLHENNNSFVAFLILFFSITVPFIKAFLLMIVLFKKEFQKRASTLRFVNVISKWSMADVFVVGVFIAFLSLKTNQNINAELHSGFYYFLSYCIISISAAQLIKVEKFN